MKPGARARPAPSISRAPRSVTRPTAAMRPPLTARSPCAASRPLPSQRSAPRMTRSAMGALVAGRGARRQGRRAATPGGVSRRGTVASLGAGGARPGAVVRPDVRLGVALALRRGLRVAALLALRRGLRVAALEVTPRELGAQDRLIAGRERERRGEELPDAHQGARDDHAEPLREAERDALAVAARAALGHDVAPEDFPHASMTKASFTATHTMSSTPLARIFWASATKPGRCFMEQVGVKAPGTAKRTTLFPLNISPRATSFGAPSFISLSFKSSGSVSPTLIAMSPPWGKG